eukprot:3308113-Pleurochrysis_carterae.AAC.1
MRGANEVLFCGDLRYSYLACHRFRARMHTRTTALTRLRACIARTRRADACADTHRNELASFSHAHIHARTRTAKFRSLSRQSPRGGVRSLTQAWVSR